jgi:hypothetical protein
VARRTKIPEREANWSICYRRCQYRDLHIVPDLIRFKGRKVRIGKISKVHEITVFLYQSN